MTIILPIRVKVNPCDRGVGATTNPNAVGMIPLVRTSASNDLSILELNPHFRRTDRFN